MTTTLIKGANQGLGLHAGRRLLALGPDVWVTARDSKTGAKVGSRDRSTPRATRRHR